MHPQHANNTGTGGKYTVIKAYMEDIIVWGLAHLYFPDPAKIILVVSDRNFVQ